MLEAAIFLAVDPLAAVATKASMCLLGRKQASLHHAREKDTVNVKNKTAATFAVLWIFCGIIDAGFLNAHLQNGFPEFCNSREANVNSPLVFSLSWGLFSGPLGLIYTLFFTSFYNDGWTLIEAQQCAAPK
jgi:hypothetical protein